MERKKKHLFLDNFQDITFFFFPSDIIADSVLKFIEITQASRSPWLTVRNIELHFMCTRDKRKLARSRASFAYYAKCEPLRHLMTNDNCPGAVRQQSRRASMGSDQVSRGIREDRSNRVELNRADVCRPCFPLHRILNGEFPITARDNNIDTPDVCASPIRLQNAVNTTLPRIQFGLSSRKSASTTCVSRVF